MDILPFDETTGEGFCEKESIELRQAERDRSCRKLSVYLFAHSVELLLKGLYIKKEGRPYNKHNVSKLYLHIKKIIEPHSFDKGELNELFLKLDQVLSWAGRYSAPVNKLFDDAVKAFATTPHGITNDIVVTVNIRLLKEFRSHVINKIFLIRAKALQRASSLESCI